LRSCRITWRLIQSPRLSRRFELPKVADKVRLDTAFNHSAAAFGFLVVDAVAAMALCGSRSGSVVSLGLGVFGHVRLNALTGRCAPGTVLICTVREDAKPKHRLRDAPPTNSCHHAASSTPPKFASYWPAELIIERGDLERGRGVVDHWPTPPLRARRAALLPLKQLSVVMSAHPLMLRQALNLVQHPCVHPVISALGLDEVTAVHPEAQDWKSSLQTRTLWLPVLQGDLAGLID
jgi:hypothetical protein